MRRRARRLGRLPRGYRGCLGTAECGHSSMEGTAAGREDAGREVTCGSWASLREVCTLCREQWKPLGSVGPQDLESCSLCVQVWGRAYTGSLQAAQCPPLLQFLCGVDPTAHFFHDSEASGFHPVSPRPTHFPMCQHLPPSLIRLLL